MSRTISSVAETKGDSSMSTSIAVVSAVDPLLRASASAVNRLRDGVGRGIVRASAQRWVNTTAHRYKPYPVGRQPVLGGVFAAPAQLFGDHVYLREVEHAF